MVNSKASRFGKKAVSLFLSGAMVVAFAPAIGAVVSEPVAFAATEAANVSDINDGTTATTVMLNGTEVPVTNGGITLSQKTIDDIMDQQTINETGYQKNLIVTAAKLDNKNTEVDMTQDWKFSVAEAKTTYTAYTPAAGTYSLKDVNGTKGTATFTDYAWDSTGAPMSINNTDWTEVNNASNLKDGQLYIGVPKTAAADGTAQGTVIEYNAQTPNITNFTDYTWHALNTNSGKWYKINEGKGYTLTATCASYLGDTNTVASFTVPITVQTATATDPEAHIIYNDKGQYVEDGGTIEVYYDGTNQLAPLSYQVIDKKTGKLMTQGTDYDVQVTAVSNTKLVSEAVNVGEYKIEIVYTNAYGNSASSGEKATIATATLNIVKAPVKDVAWANGTTVDEPTTGTNISTVEYTGSAITVTPTYYVAKAEWNNGTQTNANTAKATTVVDESIYKTTISFRAGVKADDLAKKATTVTEIKDCGEYTITMTPQVTAAGYSNYNTTTLTYKVYVLPMSATYMEIDTAKMAMNTSGQVEYSGTAITPAATVYDTDTVKGGVAKAVPTDAYKLVLKKATTVTSDHVPAGYVTVDSVTGPGYYQLWAVDADATDSYAVGSKLYTAFEAVEKAEEPVVVEKQDQDIKFTTGKNQKLKKGKKLQLKVTGAKTAVTYTKKSGSAFLTVTKSGKIKVDSSAKKGKTYHINVKAKAAASDAYNADSEVKHFCIKVK